jgi:hypothetical protein
MFSALTSIDFFSDMPNGFPGLNILEVTGPTPEYLRAELADILKAENQKLSFIEPQEHDQTQMVEQSMQEEPKSLPSLESTQPEITAQGNPDGKGYVWHTEDV